jgi:hypothetical protein
MSISQMRYGGACAAPSTYAALAATYAAPQQQVVSYTAPQQQVVSAAPQQQGVSYSAPMQQVVSFAAPQQQVVYEEQVAWYAAPQV